MLYRYTQTESPLKDVEIILGSSKPQALLYAPDSLAPEKLTAIRESLERKGFLTLLDSIDGKDVLRVERIGSRETFLAELERQHLVAGAPTMIETERDRKMVKTFREKIGENTKTAAGFGYMATDAALTLSGLLRRDYAEATAGALWGTTGVALAFFGKKNPDTQTGVLYRKLDDHLKKEGIEFPSNERQLIDTLKRDHTLVHAIEDFFYENVSDFHHAIQAVGGLTLAKAGLNQNNPYKAFAGAICATGQTMGLLPAHEKPDEKHPAAYVAADGEKPGFANGQPTPLPTPPAHCSRTKQGWDWFMSNPLHAAGILPFINNVSNIGGALHIDRRDYRSATGSAGDARVAELDREIARVKAAQIDLKPEAAIKRTEAYVKFEKELAGFAAEQSKLTKLRGAGLPVFGRTIAPHELTIGIAVGYMMANLLYAFSPKNAPCDLDRTGHLDEIEATIANIAARQPASFTTAFINRMAADLAKSKDVPLTADELANAIETKEKAIRSSRWAVKVATPEASGSAALG